MATGVVKICMRDGSSTYSLEPPKMVAKLGLSRKAISHMPVFIINEGHNKKIGRDSDKKGSKWHVTRYHVHQRWSAKSIIIWKQLCKARKMPKRSPHEACVV